jgi:hypothetical protein
MRSRRPTSPLRWIVAFTVGSALGLSLRLVAFLAGVGLLTPLARVFGHLSSVAPSVDPVYTRAAQTSLEDVQIRGLAVIGPPGDRLHALLPDLFVPAALAHWSLVRLVVEPGSPVLGRLIASGFAHAVVLAAGLLLLRYGWRRHAPALAVAGVAMQVQVAVGILGAQPSVRELEATGLSFAANALLPTLAPRGAALSDGPVQLWPPLVAAALVALALLLAYLPVGLIVLLRHRTRRIALSTVAALMLGSATCAGLLRQETTVAASAPPETAVPAATAAEPPPVAAQAPAQTSLDNLSLDNWFSEQRASQPAGPSHVEVVGSNFHYQYLVNGEPQVIKGMGLNTQYAQQLSPSDRAARIDADMSEMADMGVNTVLGWDPNEFDTVLLDAAERHRIGVVMPFDLDPTADYTDPTVRQQLHDAALAWVAQYRDHPAVRMWGLGNEVLHKIVHPAWVGPQDPAQERQAEAFSDWLIWTADDIHAMDPDHPVTYRSAEDAFVNWVIAALDRAGGRPRPWFVWGTNCYQPYLDKIVNHWNQLGMPTALWVSEFAPGGMAVPDRPDGFATMWGYVRSHPDWVLGGAVYAWTRNGPEGVDRNFGLTDDGAPVDGRSLDMLTSLFQGN